MPNIVNKYIDMFTHKWILENDEQGGVCISVKKNYYASKITSILFHIIFISTAP